MSVAGAPTASALVDAAVRATGASYGWLLEDLGPEGWRVAAASTPSGAAPGSSLPHGAGPADLALESGQPVALASGATPLVAPDVEALTGTGPRSVLAAPCSHGDRVEGVLLLADKQPSGGFSIDDVEITVLLADVAGVELAQGGASPAPRPPAELGHRLDLLAAGDPARYRTVALLVEALLAG